MALDKDELAEKIDELMAANGFKPSAEKTRGSELWACLAEALVIYIQEKAEVSVTSGSSAGTYKVT